MSHGEMVYAAWLVLAFGISDRLMGWGGWGRVLSVLSCVALLAAAGYPNGMVYSMPLCWILARVQGWDLFKLGGSINPTPMQVPGTFVRHALSLFYLVPAYLHHIDLLHTAEIMLAYAGVATVFGLFNNWTQAKANGYVEFARGCVMGFAVFYAFAL